MKIKPKTIVSFYSGRWYGDISPTVDFGELIEATLGVESVTTLELPYYREHHKEEILARFPEELQEICRNWEHTSDFEQRLQELENRFGILDINPVDESDKKIEQLEEESFKDMLQISGDKLVFIDLDTKLSATRFMEILRNIDNDSRQVLTEEQVNQIPNEYRTFYDKLMEIANDTLTDQGYVGWGAQIVKIKNKEMEFLSLASKDAQPCPFTGSKEHTFHSVNVSSLMRKLNIED